MADPMTVMMLASSFLGGGGGGGGGGEGGGGYAEPASSGYEPRRKMTQDYTPQMQPADASVFAPSMGDDEWAMPKRQEGAWADDARPSVASDYNYTGGGRSPFQRKDQPSSMTAPIDWADSGYNYWG